MPKLKTEDENYPDSYRMGSVEFFFRTFKTDERALIPRFETESLVREAIKTALNEPFDVIIDVGTGSGIVAVSLSKRFPEMPVFAFDISQDALDLAHENARSNGAKVKFFRSDLLSSLAETSIGAESSILFVANLPYVREGAQDVSPDTVYEPPLALYGGAGTGFELTARFLDEIENRSRECPDSKSVAMCEVGDDHEETASEFAKSRNAEIEFFADPYGVRRFFTYRPWRFEK